MKKNIIYLFLITQIFAFAGVGFYGDVDMFSSTPEASIDATTGITVTPGDLNNGIGGGGFVYIDFLPIIDLEFSLEAAGSLYDATMVSGLSTTELPEIPWSRLSGYVTIRKQLAGASIPFLAKVQVYAGGGVNTHWSTPTVTTDLLTGAFDNMTLTEIMAQDFTDDLDVENDPADLLLDYAAENINQTNGVHFQVGAQAKLLVANLFINARYTLAKDVVPDSPGFPSLWLGVAVGL